MSANYVLIGIKSSLSEALLHLKTFKLLIRTGLVYYNTPGNLALLSIVVTIFFTFRMNLLSKIKDHNYIQSRLLCLLPSAKGGCTCTSSALISLVSLIFDSKGLSPKFIDVILLGFVCVAGIVIIFPLI